jgi:hypothetical protein
MDKYKCAYMRLNVTRWFLAVCFLFPFLAKNINYGWVEGVWLFIFAATAFNYLYNLGVLATGSGKNVTAWVAGTVFTGPIGVIVSFALMKRVAIQQHWG